ncbi:MAG: hypothetical protein COA44_14825 [Arcobacter sp.]|nr:MAG: hypothetical protein COA44_14825 [Arcobacter sp.]
MEQITALLEKYNSFKGDILRKIEKTSETSYILTIAIQDDDGEDLNNVMIDFTNVENSKILVDSALPYMDMMSGLTLIKENGLYGFAVGRGSAMLHVNNAPLFIVSKDIKILAD